MNYLILFSFLVILLFTVILPLTIKWPFNYNPKDTPIPDKYDWKTVNFDGTCKENECNKEYNRDVDCFNTTTNKKADDKYCTGKKPTDSTKCNCLEGTACVGNECIKTGWNYMWEQPVGGGEITFKDESKDCKKECDDINCDMWIYNVNEKECELINGINPDTVCSVADKNMIAYYTQTKKYAHDPTAKKCDVCNLSNTICTEFSGKKSCCPANKKGDMLFGRNNTANCENLNVHPVVTECCLDKPGLTGYKECIKNYPDCSKLEGAQLPYEWSLTCGGVTGDNPIPFSEDVQNELSTVCKGLTKGATCTYKRDGSTLNGTCKDCGDGDLVCLPAKYCTYGLTRFKKIGTCGPTPCQ